MAEYYSGCPRCGRRDFGAILHCSRCGTEFCIKCKGKRRDVDGEMIECCPRCGAEIEEDYEDGPVRIVVTEKDNARNKR